MWIRWGLPHQSVTYLTCGWVRGSAAVQGLKSVSVSSCCMCLSHFFPPLSSHLSFDYWSLHFAITAWLLLHHSNRTFWNLNRSISGIIFLCRPVKPIYLWSPFRDFQLDRLSSRCCRYTSNIIIRTATPRTPAILPLDAHAPNNQRALAHPCHIMRILWHVWRPRHSLRFRSPECRPTCNTEIVVLGATDPKAEDPKHPKPDGTNRRWRESKKPKITDYRSIWACVVPEPELIYHLAMPFFSGGVFKETLDWTVIWWGAERRRWMHNGEVERGRPDSSSGCPLTTKYRLPANKLQ